MRKPVALTSMRTGSPPRRKNGLEAPAGSHSHRVVAPGHAQQWSEDSAWTTASEPVRCTKPSPWCLSQRPERRLFSYSWPGWANDRSAKHLTGKSAEGDVHRGLRKPWNILRNLKACGQSMSTRGFEGSGDLRRPKLHVWPALSPRASGFLAYLVIWC